jgi:hypothetical protein
MILIAGDCQLTEVFTNMPLRTVLVADSVRACHSTLRVAVNQWGCRESTPYIVVNPRQVSNLAAVHFASGVDFDTFATLEAG